MPALRTETNQLLLYDPDKSRDTVHCTIAQPTPLEERTLGKLLLLVQVESHDAINHQIIDELQKSITNYYYQSEDFEVETAFERALQATNQRLQAVLAEQLVDWVRRSNVIIAVLKDTSLHFTVIGRMHAFLVHRQRIVDILESSSGATTGEEVSPLKIFSNIISGQMNLDDSLLFCTTSVLDYLSQEKLKRVLVEQSSSDAVRTIENLLVEADPATSFGALVVKLAAAPNLEEAAAPSAMFARNTDEILKPQRSMEELIRREQKTNELLTHPIWPNVSRLLRKAGESAQSGVKQAMHSRKEKQSTDEPATTTPSLPQRRFSTPREPTRVKPILRSIGKGLLAILLFLWSMLVGIVRGIASLFKAQRVRSTMASVPHRASGGMSRGTSWFQRMGAKRQRLLIVAVVLIAVFAFSVSAIGKQQQNHKQQDTYAAAIKTAQEKVDAADAALLIKNENGARALLTEAQSALASIPDSQKKYDGDKATITASINAKLQETRHVVSVQPTSAYDLSKLEVGLTATSFLLADNTLYTYNSRSSTIYKVDLTTQKADTLVNSPSLTSTLHAFVYGSKSPVELLQDNGSLQELNTTTNALTGMTVGYPTPEHEIRAALLYNAKLYSLDAKGNQIYRHARKDKTYDTGTPWITDASVDVRDARSLTSDGSLYVAKDDGTILKLASGKKTATFQTADPSLTHPVQVFTSVDVTTVFVLEPQQKRIVEYAKDGTFQRQYVADQFANATQIHVQGGNVFVLAGTSLLKFPVSKE